MNSQNTSCQITISFDGNQGLKYHEKNLKFSVAI
jgi:hypothetical protein